MQQRVAIAATLILQPRILLMDEPFGALDPGIRLRMQELLIQLWNEQQSTVFLVTHSVEEAVYLGDRVFLHGAPTRGGWLTFSRCRARPSRRKKAGASRGSSTSARRCCGGWKRNRPRRMG